MIDDQLGYERLGATHEGTLRRHRRRADGSWRDTLICPITDDWPGVRERPGV